MLTVKMVASISCKYKLKLDQGEKVIVMVWS